MNKHCIVFSFLFALYGFGVTPEQSNSLLLDAIIAVDFKKVKEAVNVYSADVNKIIHGELNRQLWSYGVKSTSFAASPLSAVLEGAEDNNNGSLRERCRIAAFLIQKGATIKNVVGRHQETGEQLLKRYCSFFAARRVHPKTN